MQNARNGYWSVLRISFNIGLSQSCIFKRKIQKDERLEDVAICNIATNTCVKRIDEKQEIKLVYFIYSVLFLLFVILINGKAVDRYSRKAWLKLKSSKNFIAGLLASLGISNLANKIDYVIYWNITKIEELWFSIIFGIMPISIGLYFIDKEK